MSPDIQLPPDQSLRKINLGQTLILLSVSEDGIRLGEGSDQGMDVQDTPKGYYVFAEKIQLHNSFTVTLESNSSIFTISTRAFASVPGKSSELSVSGAAGKNNDTGAMRQESINGKPSGSFSIYVEECGSDIAHLLKLSAEGGKGGDTKERKGIAGDGGAGGNIQWVGYSAFTEFSALLYQFATNEVLNHELPNEDVLTPPHPITIYLQKALANAALIQQLSHTGSDIQPIAAICKPIKAVLDRVTASSNKATIGQARDAVWDVRQAITTQYTADKAAVVANMSVVGGNGGAVDSALDASERGSAGVVGKRGTLKVTLLRDVGGAELRQQSVVFVHPDQCQMLYDRAMSYWYFGRNATAIELLSRLLLRLSFLPLKDDDPLSKVGRPIHAICQYRS